MKYTVEDIKKSFPESKAKKEPFWGRVFLRRTSFYITYFFINHNWTPNKVSLLSCIVAIIGCILLCFDQLLFIWMGVFILNIWSVLDCVDGNIARCLKKTSLAGEFFDAVGGYTISAFIMPGVGMAAYHTTGLFGQYRIYLIFIASLAGICDIFSRLIYQKYSNSMMQMEYKRIGADGIAVENSGFYSNDNHFSFIKKLSLYIDYEFGIGGDELMFLIIAVLINKIDIFLIMYSLYYIMGFVLVFIIYTKKMFNYEKEYLN
ncbi:MAG: CDP-alcohol phosphatidyltransferase family protein [Lachnospiraceae bacterium]|nr:CDP-alcohol phosphatidyltransferase family protein [Lachnospiraceae bacterium]